MNEYSASLLCQALIKIARAYVIVNTPANDVTRAAALEQLR